MHRCAVDTVCVPVTSSVATRDEQTALAAGCHEQTTLVATRDVPAALLYNSRCCTVHRRWVTVPNVVTCRANRLDCVRCIRTPYAAPCIHCGTRHTRAHDGRTVGAERLPDLIDCCDVPPRMRLLARMHRRRRRHSEPDAAAVADLTASGSTAADSTDAVCSCVDTHRTHASNHHIDIGCSGNT